MRRTCDLARGTCDENSGWGSGDDLQVVEIPSVSSAALCGRHEVAISITAAMGDLDTRALLISSPSVVPVMSVFTS